MNININTLSKVDAIFNKDCGYSDTRHKLNLCNRPVPQEMLDEVEKGCPLEALRKLANDFLICTYKTQITIHGLFPPLSTNRIGGYVNLVRNQNGSVGIRWNAIDHEKKARLYRIARVCANFHVSECSSYFYISKVERITHANEEKVLSDFRAIADRIDRSLFYGGVEVYTGWCWAQKFAVLKITVNAFPETHFDILSQQITGMDKATIETTMSEHEAEQERKRIEDEARWAKAREDRLAREREIAEMNAKWLADNPAPFAVRRGYTLKPGDIYAVPEKDRAGRYVRWGFRKAAKSFGRITIAPCDIEGNSVPPSAIGIRRKARVTTETTGDFRVKCA